MVGDPDPYTATMNAVQFFHISEIVISTLPEASSFSTPSKSMGMMSSSRPM